MLNFECEMVGISRLCDYTNLQQCGINPCLRSWKSAQADSVLARRASMVWAGDFSPAHLPQCWWAFLCRGM